MSSKFSNSAHFSQFETLQPQMRVVLLGASNLAMTLPRVISSARAAFDAPLEFFVATGFGRSYGQESKFFWKKFSGILQSGIWAALDRAPPLPTVALVTDVGNDLAYEAPVETVLAWVTTTFERLALHDARIVLNNLPIVSLRTVGALRYQALRAVLFPRCRIPGAELLDRAEALSDALAALADSRKIPVFSAQNAWYGLDPIHPRRRHAGAIWQQMIGALAPRSDSIAWITPSRAEARLIRRARLSSSVRNAAHRPPPEPPTQLCDGSTLALF
jgi:hypothetical protein